MKSLSLSFFIILFFSFNLLAQTENRDSVKVWGNCGMCKRTIESAAKKGGALTADWNKETKMLSFSVDAAGSSHKVQESIAAAGYDTRDLTASNDAYDKLPGCCKYDRKAAVSAEASSSSEAKHESCGKCTPCREGTWWLVQILRDLENGTGTEADLEKLLDLCDNILGRSFCALGDGATSPITSSIQYFRDEYIAHLTNGGCPFDPVKSTLFSGALS